MNIPGFIQEHVLGKGSYGTVYKAKRIADGTSYAVKIVNTAGMSKREMEDALNEIRLMASFKSPFIVSFCEAFAKETKLCVITEYARLGDLSKLIDRRKRQSRPLLEDDIWRFLIQVTEGLSVLHESGVVHRDIKSANLLLCAPDLVKIGDLGISTVLHNHTLAKTQIGTPLYLAPEIWRRRPYDSKCDMWSLGVVLYEMLTFSFPFIGNTTQELGRRILAGRIGPIRGAYSQEIQSVLRSLLQTNPDLRPSAKQLLESHAFQSRMHLINGVVVPVLEEHQMLLQTIKMPHNIRQVSFPQPTYDNSNELVKPINERLHFKGPQKEKDADLVSTRELMMVADHDWWSPKKLKIKEEDTRHAANKTPLSSRSPYVPPILPNPPKHEIVRPIIKKPPNQIPMMHNNENANPNQCAEPPKRKPVPPSYAGVPACALPYWARRAPPQENPFKAKPPMEKPKQAVAPRRQISYVVPPWGYAPNRYRY